MPKQKFLIAVGSSGGHIYPAIAIAESLEKELLAKGLQDSDIEIHFAHARSFLCEKILSQTKYKTHAFSIGGLASGLAIFNKIKTLFQIPIVFLKVYFLIRKHSFKVVLGTGGSVTGPCLLAAKMNFCYTCIWDGNSHLGLANKLLTPFVNTIFTTFKNVPSVPEKKHIHCGYPLRQNIEMALQNNPASLNSDSQFKIFILGGSQGSVLLNQAISEMLKDSEWRKNIFIYHQTGIKHYEQIKKEYQHLEGVECFDFSADIYRYYQNSDLIISRAGAGAIFEIAAFKKALILVPLTHSAGGHQLQNAKALHTEQAAEILEEKDFNAENLKNMILNLKNQPAKLENLRNNLYKQYQKEGAKVIAQNMTKHH